MDDDKKVYFGWGLTLWDNDTGTLTSEDWDKAVELLERNFIELIQRNLPAGSYVANEYHYTDDGIESVTLSSYIPADKVKELFNIGFEPVMEGILVASTASGTLGMPQSLYYLDKRFDLELEIQFENPIEH